MTKYIELILPPSVNKLYITRKGTYKRILTAEGRDYIYTYSLEIAQHLRKIKLPPFESHFYLDINWYLPRRNCDSHNYEKALFDMLEQAGLTVDDKYIMNRTQNIEYDTKNPRVIISFEI